MVFNLNFFFNFKDDELHTNEFSSLKQETDLLPVITSNPLFQMNETNEDSLVFLLNLY